MSYEYLTLSSRASITFPCAFRMVWSPSTDAAHSGTVLLVDVDPQFGMHRLVKAIKGRSSRLLREEFSHLKSRLPTLWTNSYFVATVGGAPL